MSTENRLNIDPRDVAVNDSGDVMPPTEEVFQRRNLRDNKLFLEIDHPGMNPIDEAVIRGISAAKSSLDQAAAETLEPETTSTPPRAVIGSRAQKNLDSSVRPEISLPKPANPYSRSPAALRRENNLLGQPPRLRKGVR